MKPSSTQGDLGGGLSWIKSSNNMFVLNNQALNSNNRMQLVHKNIEELGSDNESDLSVGDANYPIISFNKWSVKDFTPK